jgi:hypothetical protein
LVGQNCQTGSYRRSDLTLLCHTDYSEIHAAAIPPQLQRAVAYKNKLGRQKHQLVLGRGLGDFKDEQVKMFHVLDEKFWR